jgi:hypothetical protein
MRPPASRQARFLGPLRASLPPALPHPGKLGQDPSLGPVLSSPAPRRASGLRPASGPPGLSGEKRKTGEFTLPWMGGRKLINLLLMKEYFPSNIVHAYDALTQSEALLTRAGTEKLTGAVLAEFQKMLSNVITRLRFLGLNSSVVYAERLMTDCSGLACGVLSTRLGLLKERVDDDLQLISLLYISPEKKAYFDRTDLFGNQFKTAFPMANQEVTEAGDCFALSRHTACVFHLMRAVEIGVKVISKTLGITAPLAKDWGGMLSDIDAAIKAKNASPPPDWTTQKDFFQKAHGFLYAIKNPVRNATMHVDATYDEGGAENVFDAVKAFMRHLATVLKE